MTERKVKLDRANKSILLRALGDVYYGQRAHGGSTEVTGRLILRVNDLPAGGKLTLSAAEYRLAKAALNQLRTQRLAEGGYTDAVDDALRGCSTPTRRCLSGESGYDMGKILVERSLTESAPKRICRMKRP